MIKRIISLFLTLCISFFAISCKEDYYGHAELRISLSNEFESFKAEGFDAAYTDGECIVGIYRISFEASFNEGIPDFLTPREFAAIHLKQSKKEAEIKRYGTVPYYEYTEIQDGIKNSYIASFFRSKFAYFVVIFACPETLYDEKAAKMLSYTETVIFIK